MLDPRDAELVADVEDGDGHPLRRARSPRARAAARDVQTTAPESESSTMRPAPTRLKASALSRGSPTWPKYRVNTLSRSPQPLKEIGTACSKGAERDHQEAGGERQRDAEGVRDRTVVPDASAWTARLAASANSTVETLCL